MFDWLHRFFGRRAPDAPEAEKPPSRADRHAQREPGMLERERAEQKKRMDAFVQRVEESLKSIRIEGGPPNIKTAMDAVSAMDGPDGDGPGCLPIFKQVALQPGAQLSLMPWFMQQGFIGYQNAAFLAQHWLIYKACAVPVDDAVRVGYDITTVSGEDIDEEALKLIKEADKRVGLIGEMRDFGIKGRIFGVRIALFEVESEDKEYYEKPFNIDGVTKGSYKGISQIDPYWCAPILSMEAAATPSARHFYEPTWWLIGSRKVHRSHLVIFRYADPPDVLKPMYLFGGIPLPQMIMERVYCAERTANEAPALALSKRTTVWLTDMAMVMADTQKANTLMEQWVSMRDNFGIKMGDKTKDEFDQFDTPLADFDGLVMTQYGLVAATAGCPITKLLGTTPGGFAATGDYDESSYHELLESMQERDLTPFANRHHQLVMKSEVIPKFPKLKDEQIVVSWHSLDVMTHVEQSQVNLNKAETGNALIASGALTPQDERARVAADRESGYHGIGKDLETETVPDLDDPDAAAEAAGPARHGAKAAEEGRAAAGGKKKSANGRLNGSK